MSYTFTVNKTSLTQEELEAIAAITSVSQTIVIVYNEIPSGIINGINRIFSLAFSPNPSTSLMLFMNGLLQIEGLTKNYLLTGSEILFNEDNIPLVDSNLIATYQKIP